MKTPRSEFPRRTGGPALLLAALLLVPGPAALLGAGSGVMAAEVNSPESSLEDFLDPTLLEGLEVGELLFLASQASRLQREIQRSIQALLRAKNPTSFRRAKSRLQARLRELTALLALAGLPPGQIAFFRREINGLLRLIPPPRRTPIRPLRVSSPRLPRLTAF